MRPSGLNYLGVFHLNERGCIIGRFVLRYTQPEGNKESEESTMKELWMSVHIINHSNGDYSCWMGQRVDDGEMQITNLSYEKACKLMWELKLAGGDKEMGASIPGYPKLVERTVTYLLIL